MNDTTKVIVRLMPSELEKFRVWEIERCRLRAMQEAAECGGHIEAAGKYAVENQHHWYNFHSMFEVAAARCFEQLPDPESYFDYPDNITISGDGSVTAEFISKPKL